MQHNNVTVGAVYGSWTVDGLDSVNKRARCKCQCGAPGFIAVEALTTGLSLGCGCVLSPRLKQPMAAGRRQAKFAAEFAALEQITARRRHARR